MSDAAWALVIGGDMATRTVLRFILEQEGYQVRESAHLGPHAALPPAEDVALVILLDVRREPDIVGPLMVLRHLGIRAPVVLLGHNISADVRRQASDFGIRDMIHLPMAPSDLQMRLSRVLRRDNGRGIARARTVSAGGWTLTTDTRRLSDSAGWAIHLTPHETSLLYALLRAPGQVLSRMSLTDQVWGEGTAGSDTMLSMLMYRLREKIERSGGAYGRLRTLPRQGYMYEARASARQPRRLEPENRPRVLLIGEDATGAVAAALREAGYLVVSAGGKEAMTLAREERPSVIIIDVAARGMNVSLVQRRLREDARTSHIPIIAMAESGRLEEQLGAIETDDYLAKPVEKDELLLRVGRLAQPHAYAAFMNDAKDATV